tara:strand:+ start:358 stop:576 length:219 start_codon:yes stop_codon:yes gene_type:complete
MYLEVILIIIGTVNLGFAFYNYFSMQALDRRMKAERFCRYPDTNVRDILIDYELEKVKKLDKALHDVENKTK